MNPLLRRDAMDFHDLIFEMDLYKGRSLAFSHLVDIDLEELCQIFIMADRDQFLAPFPPAQKPEVILMGPDEGDGNDDQKSDSRLPGGDILGAESCQGLFACQKNDKV